MIKHQDKMNLCMSLSMSSSITRNTKMARYGFGKQINITYGYHFIIYRNNNIIINEAIIRESTITIM